MVFRPAPVSRSERIASTATALVITAGYALLIVAVSRPQFAIDVQRTSIGATRESAEPVYLVGATSAPTAALSGQPRQSSGEGEREVPISGAIPVLQGDTASEARPTRPSAVNDPTAGLVPSMEVLTARARLLRPLGDTMPGKWESLSRARAGASRGGGVGLPNRPFGPLRFDSAVAAGIAARRGAPPTQEERDAELRRRAVDQSIARAAGTPAPIGNSGGGSVSVPLPFGGPSREQRRRDSATHAQNRVMLARLKQRADSLAALRKRLRSDSLARVADSLRRVKQTTPADSAS